MVNVVPLHNSIDSVSSVIRNNNCYWKTGETCQPSLVYTFLSSSFFHSSEMDLRNPVDFFSVLDSNTVSADINLWFLSFFGL